MELNFSFHTIRLDGASGLYVGLECVCVGVLHKCVCVCIYIYIYIDIFFYTYVGNIHMYIYIYICDPYKGYPHTAKYIHTYIHTYCLCTCACMYWLWHQSRPAKISRGFCKDAD